MDWDQRFPELCDLRTRARQRVPRFVWEYLDSGTGAEATKRRNRRALDRIGFMPSVLHGTLDCALSVPWLGGQLPFPVGMSPIGMSGLIWPNAEQSLARAARTAAIPYCLSTVASQSPEDLTPDLGDEAWFQLYPPKDPEIRQDMLNRVKSSGFKSLVITLDVPVASRRERQTRSGLTQPPRLTPRLLAQIATHPAWALGMARRGMPRMRMLDKYTTTPNTARSSTNHVGYLLRTSPDWDYIDWLRQSWDGPLIAKGVLRPDDAAQLEQAGCDAIWVSNHAGRQFDAAPATIEVLPSVRGATNLPIIFDSGVETGLDILRAYALGADLVMMGRGFHFALAALGESGPAHLIDILSKDLRANMGQIGISSLPEVRHVPRVDLTSAPNR